MERERDFDFSETLDWVRQLDIEKKNAFLSEYSHCLFLWLGEQGIELVCTTEKTEKTKRRYRTKDNDTGTLLHQAIMGLKIHPKLPNLSSCLISLFSCTQRIREWSGNRERENARITGRENARNKQKTIQRATWTDRTKDNDGHFLSCHWSGQLLLFLSKKSIREKKILEMDNSNSSSDFIGIWRKQNLLHRGETKRDRDLVKKTFFSLSTTFYFVSVVFVVLLLPLLLLLSYCLVFLFLSSISGPSFTISCLLIPCLVLFTLVCLTLWLVSSYGYLPSICRSMTVCLMCAFICWTWVG